MTTLDAPRLLADTGWTTLREGPRILARCWPATALYVLLGAQSPWSSPLGLPFYLVLLVTIHRTVLLPNRSTSDGPAWFPARADWHYARAWLRMVLPLLGASLVAAAALAALMPLLAASESLPDSTIRPVVMVTLMGIVYLPLLWVFARASVLFPAAAIGESPRWIRDAFAITRGHTLALMTVIGIPAACGLAIDAFIESSFAETDGIGVALAARLVSLAVLVFETVALSLVYRQFRGTLAVPPRRRPFREDGRKNL